MFEVTGSRPWDYFHLYCIAYFSILAVIPGILAIRLRRWTVERGNTNKFLIGLLLIAGLLLILHPLQCNYKALQYSYWDFPPGSIFFNISFCIMLLFCLIGAAMIGYAVKLYFRREVKKDPVIGSGNS